MSTAAAPAPEAPSANIGRLTDRIADSIDFDFDLGDGVDKPDTPQDINLDPEDFDEGDDDDSEPTKPEKPAAKPKPAPVAPATPEEPEPPPAAAKAKSALPLDRGTEDKPYSVNDLPGDRFVRLKIDGQEETLPMRELADGYIRKRTFDSSLSSAKQVIQDAERIAKGHIEERTKLRSDMDAFLGNHERIFKYLLARDPDVMLQLGSLIGEQYGAWQADPTARAKHDYARQQRQLQVERQRLEADQRSHQEQRQRAEAAEQARKVWQPLWQEAVKEAGFPKVTPEFQDTVKALVSQANKRGGGKMDAATFKAIVKRAAKLVEAETVERRTPAAQAAPAARERAAAPRASDKKWENMTHAQRMRDPDWLLRKR